MNKRSATTTAEYFSGGEKIIMDLGIGKKKAESIAIFNIYIFNNYLIIIYYYLIYEITAFSTD